MSSAAIAAAAMAALTASQAPGIELVRPGSDDDGPTDSMPDLPPGDDSYHTELPPLRTPAPPEGDAPGIGADESGIPATVLAAYKKAERSLAASDPGCNLPWELLAAIGKVESGQARGGAVDDAGTTLSPILGPQLNGEGFARITDTDNGVYDGDERFDRAVGPMQFIPSTWETWGADGNGDGKQDPNNVFDAALAAGAYLCHGERDLAIKADLDRAILSYNHSRDYLNTVLAWLEFYRDGVHKVPDGTGVLPTSPGAGTDDDAADRRSAPKGDGEGGGDGREQSDDPPASGGDGTDPGGDGNGSGDTSEGDGSDGDGTDPSGGGDGTDPGDGETDSGGETQDPEPDDSTDPTEPPANADDVPASLDRVAGDTVTVPAGGTIAEGLDVRVLTDDARPVPGAAVKYVITDQDGTEGVRFAGGGTESSVTANDDGVAAAPDLQAGSHAGTFTVRATVVGHDGVEPAQFTVTVEATQLQRTADQGTAISAQAGTTCPAIQIRATRGGRATAGLAVTGTVLAPGGTTPAAEDGTMPYFQPDGTESPTNTFTLKTAADGTLTLPELHAGSQADTYKLKLTTADGGVLVLAVEITEAETSGEPTASPSPSPS